ncbi:hypothetical protein T492DRAFT_892762 [Pavlovales sp. CCMP2436]|nr:hypothetical protein T492DRAFT_892762 [Pavlovales sp. CCMP2436]
MARRRQAEEELLAELGAASADDAAALVSPQTYQAVLAELGLPDLSAPSLRAYTYATPDEGEFEVDDPGALGDESAMLQELLGSLPPADFGRGDGGGSGSGGGGGGYPEESYGFSLNASAAAAQGGYGAQGGYRGDVQGGYSGYGHGAATPPRTSAASLGAAAAATHAEPSAHTWRRVNARLVANGFAPLPLQESFTPSAAAGGRGARGDIVRDLLIELDLARRRAAGGEGEGEGGDSVEGEAPVTTAEFKQASERGARRDGDLAVASATVARLRSELSAAKAAAEAERRVAIDSLARAEAKVALP